MQPDFPCSCQNWPGYQIGESKLQNPPYHMTGSVTQQQAGTGDHLSDLQAAPEPANSDSCSPDSWTIDNNCRLGGRNYYFSRLFIAPRDEPRGKAVSDFAETSPWFSSAPSNLEHSIPCQRHQSPSVQRGLGGG